MKKALVLIVVSVLLAALLCIAGCSSDVSYTDEDTGVTVSLPDSWEESSDLEADNCFLAFTYEDPQNESVESISCYVDPEYMHKSISEYSKKIIEDYYSDQFKINDLEEKKLSSGTYYVIKGTSDDYHQVIYLTIEDNHLIQYCYASKDPETPNLSTFENMVDKVEYKANSSDGNGSATNSDDESKSKEYTDKKVGFSVTLPNYWIEVDTEELKDESEAYDNMCMGFNCGNFLDNASIACFVHSGFKNISVADLSREGIAELYSVSADDVSKKKLSSGTYYLLKRTFKDDSGDDHYSVVYLTVKNGYLIQFECRGYAHDDNDCPFLSDFEDMVDSAKYK